MFLHFSFHRFVCFSFGWSFSFPLQLLLSCTELNGPEEAYLCLLLGYALTVLSPSVWLRVREGGEERD